MTFPSQGILNFPFFSAYRIGHPLVETVAQSPSPIVDLLSHPTVTSHCHIPLSHPTVTSHCHIQYQSSLLSHRHIMPSFDISLLPPAHLVPSPLLLRVMPNFYVVLPLLRNLLYNILYCVSSHSILFQSMPQWMSHSASTHVHTAQPASSSTLHLSSILKVTCYMRMPLFLFYVIPAVYTKILWQ